jgi:hypothetical protein
MLSPTTGENVARIGCSGHVTFEPAGPRSRVELSDPPEFVGGQQHRDATKVKEESVQRRQLDCLSRSPAQTPKPTQPLLTASPDSNCDDTVNGGGDHRTYRETVEANRRNRRAKRRSDEQPFTSEFVNPDEIHLSSAVGALRPAENADLALIYSAANYVKRSEGKSLRRSTCRIRDYPDQEAIGDAVNVNCVSMGGMKPVPAAI